MNKAILMGRMTKDPELRYTSNNNTAVCSFTIAVDRRFKQEGQEVDFINCQAWSKTAEFIGKYFAKGRKIVVVGRIQTRSYDKDGQKVYITEIVVDEAYFADSKLAGQPQNNNGFVPVEDDDELPF